MRTGILALLLTALASGASAQTISSPSAQVTVPAAQDYAVRVMQDRWDMSQRSDLGWFVNSVDQPVSQISSPAFHDGAFTGVSTSTGPNLFLVETGNPVAAPTGKNGVVYPIDANTYQRLTFRMCLGGLGGQSPTSALLLWSRQTLYQDLSVPNAFFVYPGCQIYSLNLKTWSQSMPAVGAGYSQFPWSGTMRMLRLNPTSAANQSITLDWVALTAVNNASTTQTITWTGASAVDIYLDGDNNAANGTLGLLWQDGTLAQNRTGGLYSFQIGALPPGDYYVAMRPSGSGAPLVYSSGFYHVEGVPTISVLSPSEDGSADDFATVQLGNPWDMRDAADVERQGHITGGTITSMNLETLSGASVPAHPVFSGVSVAGSSDPQLELLFSGGRGRSYRIDTSRYRILSAEVGIAGARDIVNGSIARVIWKRSDESLANVSQDVIINHRAGVNSMDKIVVDMADRNSLPLETDPGGSPSHSGWTGLVDEFRIDPHEFSAARGFWLGRVRLSSFERAAHTYTIRWRLADVTDPSVGVSLYYDVSNTGFGGTQVVGNLAPSTEGDGSGAYDWDINGVPNGTYYVYVRVTSSTGTLLNQAYSRWPVVVDHSYVAPPVISLGRSSLAFAAINNGKTTTKAQDVTVSFANGATPWSASSSNCNFVKFTGGTGTGNGLFSVYMEQRSTYPAGAHLVCTVRVDAPGAANTPQFISLTFDILRSSAPPFGTIDTPANNATVSGAVGITGWALDDLEVASISIYRDKVAGETATSPNGKIYLGNAAFLEGARPDLETAYPSLPWAYRAGWGALILTNMLPFQGNGSFTFSVYATDVEGKQTLLGSRRVTGANNTSVLPFGTIDTPGPGQVASGTVVNFGWALTPQPNAIPTDGSTIWVYIDSVPVGHPVYNQFRSDIANLFPGYANTNGAIGYYILDTTTLANGLHTIAWSVTDTAGNVQGIGSRFFRVRN